MANQSSLLGLSRATLRFAEKSTRRRRDNTPNDAPIQHAVALTETMMRFKSCCSSSIRPDSVAKLTVFFEVTVGSLIDDGKMGWIGERVRRPFALACVEFLAASADAIARGTLTSITPRVLDIAAREMIQAKEPNCPLPARTPTEITLKPFGSACMALSKVIGGELVKKGRKGRD